MKHVDSGGNTIAAPSGNVWKIIVAVALVLAMLLLQNELWAQCTMLCKNPDPSAPLLIPIDSACNASVSAVNLLHTPSDCPGRKTLTVRTGTSEVVAYGADSVQFFATTYLNQLLSVTVADSASGILCVSFIIVVDKTPPVISCTDLTINCLQEATPSVVQVPSVTDNCEVDLNIAYLDEIVGTHCEKGIKRTWIAADRSGNKSTCVQNITITRLPLDSVVFPQDTILKCDTANVFTIQALGQPRLQGIVVDSLGSICQFYARSVDSIRTICGRIGYDIQRYWTVTDTCSGLVRRDTQLIRVEDRTAPVLSTQELLILQTDPRQCAATVTLPAPTISDNCDPTPRFFVSTSYGAVGLGPHQNVPVGNYTVQYTGVDTCGNTRVWTMMLAIVDQEAPVAVCEGFTAVSLPAVGAVRISARTFDKGSRDNCAGRLYFKVKKPTPGTCEGLNGDDSQAVEGAQEWFDDHVFFCCEEVGGKAVPVLFRVYEINPGEGPVNPAREQPGGDLYGHFTECVIEVEVQDKLAPTLTCPKDTTIDCTDDYTNLTRFGSPIVKDNCGYTLDSTIVKDLNECGTGTIQRTFMAKDRHGNTMSCTQTITVVNKNPLKMSDIQWPKHYDTDFCNAKTDPKDLPAGFDKPIIEKRECSLVAVGHTDQLFDVARPACYKILRTWEVIDWCVYEPQNPALGGKFTFTQVITVTDQEPPVLSCPTDVVVPTSNTCGAVRVTLPDVTAEDCSLAITITNDSPYATAKGANASGNYPPGVHTVTFTAKDGCGNTATCKVKITVVDQTPPTAICIVGLSANLVHTDGEIKAVVKATAFNAGNTDNCTPANRLKYTIRRAGDTRPPVDTQLVFRCEDLGSQLIEFFVTDEKGNTANCVTFLAVQDNNQVCPAIAGGKVAGGIQTEKGDEVEGVQIKVNNSSALQAFTGHNGLFEFPNLPIGKDYTIVPEKDSDLLNGISTLDIVLISKHILGTQKLNTPYKIIAADLDRSGSITALDLLRLRKLVLGLETSLPNGNRSWRFVDAKHQFANPQNPFQREFPEIYNINDFDGKLMKIDFVAIKVGDVDGSVQANNATAIEQRAADRTLTLTAADRVLQSGETFTVDFHAADLTQILGYQMAMRFDPALLELLTVENGELPDMSDANFNTANAAAGLLTTSWNTPAATPLGQETVLFSLTFRAKTAAVLSKALQLDTRTLAPEGYESEADALIIKLLFKNKDHINVAPVQEKFELYQNAPNPFATQTVVSFRLPQTSVARLIVFDAAGRIVYNKEGTFTEGYNEIVITRDEVQGEGMLYYRLETQEGKNATRKMMLLD